VRDRPQKEDDRGDADHVEGHVRVGDLPRGAAAERARGRDERVEEYDWMTSVVSAPAATPTSGLSSRAIQSANPPLSFSGATAAPICPSPKKTSPIPNTATPAWRHVSPRPRTWSRSPAASTTGA
jgi:hypothetical protein